MRNRIAYVAASLFVLSVLASCTKEEVVDLDPDNTNPVDDTTLVNPTDTTVVVEDTTVTYSETVDTVIISRYAGLWYEIGSIPQVFQTGCNCTTAEYAAISENQISVTNACNLFSTTGFENRIEGTATIVPNSGNAKLLVSFFGFGAADYWIIDLHPDYEWAVVGSANKQSFWILSRTPTFDQHLYDELLAKWGARGYDVSRVQATQQNGCQ
jgi:apolipoprotein D and lipocalin family protein